MELNAVFAREMQDSAFDNVLYINWIDETHTLNEHSSIDVTDDTPMIEETPPNIQLQLFPQQRIIAKAFLDVEKKGYVKTFVPPISIDQISIAKADVCKFYSNLWRINMPVGSGKTAIVFSIVSKRPIPEHRKVITGQDGIHTSMLYSPGVYSILPRHDLFRVSQCMDWPCYFESDSKKFPKLGARAKGESTVKHIIPLNLYFVAPHLYQQIAEYLRVQVSFEYKLFTNRGAQGIASIFDFIIDIVCQKPSINNIKLVLVPLVKYSIANYAYAINRIDFILDAKRNPSARQVNPRIVSRLNKLKLLLENSADPSSYELFQLVSFADSDIRYYARVFYDDYDSMVSIGSSKICALSHIFISSSNINRNDSDLGPNRKLLRTTFMRIMSNISISEEKVKNLLKLKEPATKDFQCIEDFQKVLTKHCLNGITYIAKTYATISLMLQRKISLDSDQLATMLHDYMNPVNALVEEIIDAFNGDGETEFIKKTFELNQVLLRVGLQMVELDSEEKNVRKICDAIYRTYNSHNIILNLTRIATQLLHSLIDPNNSTQRPSAREIAGVSTIWRNFIEKFAFPPRKLPFEEAVKPSDDYAALLYNLSRAKNPTNGDDLLRIMEGNHKAACLFAPHALAYTRHKAFVLQISMIDIVDNLKNFSEVYSILDNDLAGLPTIHGKCASCQKSFSQTFYITSCCGIAVCKKCYEQVFGKDVNGTIRCRACLEPAVDSRNIMTLFSQEFVKSGAELADICANADTYKCNSPYIPPTIEYLQPTLRITAKNTGSAFTRTINNKKQMLIGIVRKLREVLKREPIVLLYARHSSDWSDATLQLIRKHKLTAEYFTAHNKRAYENGRINIIVVNSVSRITGFNMQYLDAIIFYSPEKNSDVRMQIVGRAQRILRDPQKRLYIYTLFYPSERNWPENRGQHCIN